MKVKLLSFIVLLLVIFSFYPCFAKDLWEFKLTHETQQLTDSPFFLITAGDVNKNGIKELIVTDFGRFGDHIDEWKEWKKVPTSFYNLFILEWEKSELKTKWSKRWDMTKMHSDAEADRYFVAFQAKQMVSWQIGDRVIVETIPPYLGIEWVKDKYVLHEQQGSSNKGLLVGSWAFPWLSASCYQNFPNKTTWPRECLVGIRDFSTKGYPKIVTITEEKIGEKQYKQTLSVRKFEPGFPIEWELQLDFRNYHYGSPLYIDRLNLRAKGMLLIDAIKLSDKKSYSSFVFEPDALGKGYILRPVKKQTKAIISKDLPITYLTLYDYPDIYLTTYDLPDVYLRSTQNKGIEEFWGYRRVDIPNPKYNDFILLLRRVTVKLDLTGFIKEDINFDHHKLFLGVGFFDLKDLDGDGLDEVILVEETGKREFGFETIYYSDTKDYIRILKWDGKKYKTMWVSPPYTKRGTKFLIEDIKNTGKKQLVVMTSNGTIQIWERQ